MSTELTCPYCELPAKLVDSIVIYKTKSYGSAYICSNYPTCDSYVGCHPNTTNPLGRLANRELRSAKGAAHVVFDALWRKKAAKKGETKKSARTAGYAWLARQLGIDPKDCHLGMFDVAQCQRVIEICKPYVQARETANER